MTVLRSGLSSDVARRGRRIATAEVDHRPYGPLLFNAVFCVLAIGSGASPAVPATWGAGRRLAVLAAAFVASAAVTPLLLAGIRRLPRWRAWKLWLGRLVGSCAVVVLSSIAEVESADWVPSPAGRRGGRRGTSDRRWGRPRVGLGAPLAPAGSRRERRRRVVF